MLTSILNVSTIAMVFHFHLITPVTLMEQKAITDRRHAQESRDEGN